MDRSSLRSAEDRGIRIPEQRFSGIRIPPDRPVVLWTGQLQGFEPADAESGRSLRELPGMALDRSREPDVRLRSRPVENATLPRRDEWHSSKRFERQQFEL